MNKKAVLLVGLGFTAVAVAVTSQPCYPSYPLFARHPLLVNQYPQYCGVMNEKHADIPESSTHTTTSSGSTSGSTTTTTNSSMGTAVASNASTTTTY